MTRADLHADKDHPSDNGRYLPVGEVHARLDRMREQLHGNTATGGGFHRIGGRR